MAANKAAALNEIFRLLSEQSELLKHWPYTAEQITKDREISARIRGLIDQICVEQSATSALAKVHFEEPVVSRL
jgi:hypothetical protein